MSDPMETAEIVAFVKAVDCHSLSRAAAELGIPRATLSRRLARLEERLGARLLRRSTRSLAMTDAGESFNRHARIALDAVSTAEASVRRVDDVVRGDLRVSVPPMLPESFRTLLCEFIERHPDVRLSLHASSRIVDLRRDGYDVALRSSSEMEPGLIARTLARDPMLGVASPAYLAEHGTPSSLRDLPRHRCLMGFARGELPQSHWGSGAVGKVHVDGAFFTNELLLLRDAALRGLGIAFMPLMLVHEELRSGALVQVLQGKLRGEALLAVVYPERQFVPPAVRAFVDAVVEWASRALVQQIPGECRTAWAQSQPEPVASRRSGKRGRATRAASGARGRQVK